MASEIKVDTISENTSANGIAISNNLNLTQHQKEILFQVLLLG